MPPAVPPAANPGEGRGGKLPWPTFKEPWHEHKFPIYCEQLRIWAMQNGNGGPAHWVIAKTDAEANTLSAGKSNLQKINDQILVWGNIFDNFAEHPEKNHIVNLEVDQTSTEQIKKTFCTLVFRELLSSYHMDDEAKKREIKSELKNALKLAAV